jgi:enoyl-CoA hydratase/carnithine racemase
LKVPVEREREDHRPNIMAEQYQYDYFNVTFPAEHVAHVEINRPEKMNAFIEQYVSCCP